MRLAAGKGQRVTGGAGTSWSSDRSMDARRHIEAEADERSEPWAGIQHSLAE